MATVKSCKYKDIISKSDEVSSGCPKVYQLKPNQDTETEQEPGTVRRLTVGKKTRNSANRTILLVGETGSGKSTLINALVNYAMGVTWEDEVWFKVVDEKETKQSESQTSDVVVYEVFGFEGQVLPFSLTLIDTPGYGDTRGTKEDAIVTQRLYKLFKQADEEDGVKEISAVALVVKASENRVTDRMRYIFNSVMSLFGKDMEKNIIVLMTHSCGSNITNLLTALKEADVKCAKNEKNQPIHFLFNNFQHEDRTKGDEDELEFAFNKSRKGMMGLKSFLEKKEPQSIEHCLDVLSECKRLPAIIQNLQERVEFTSLKQRAIQMAKNDVTQCVKGMQEIVEVDEPYKTTQSISGGWWGLWFYDGALRCTNCEENCHYPGCSIAARAGHCEVIKGGKCTSCTNKCDVSHHVKDTKIYVTNIKTLKMSLEEAHGKYGTHKEKYDECEANSKESLKLLKLLEKEVEALKTESKHLLDEAYGAVVKLHDITLNSKSMHTHVHLQWLIERMNVEKQPEKAMILQDIKKDMDKDVGFMMGLKYKFASLMVLK